MIPKYIFNTLFLLTALVMRFLSSETAAVSFFALAAYALLGRKEAIQALAATWFLSMINTTLAPEVNAESVGRYVVIITASFSVFWRNRYLTQKKVSFVTILLGVALVIHSLMFSLVAEVSILKVFSWILVVTTLLSAWQSLLPAQHTALFDSLKAGLILILILSIPLLAFPHIGFARNGSGFQGLMNHPQAFGPTMALLAAIQGGKVLGMPKPSWVDISILGLCFTSIVLSEARTAGLALILGLSIAAVISPILAKRSWKAMLPGLISRRFQVFGIFALIAIVVSSTFLADRLTEFLFKRSETTSFIAAVEASRGNLVYPMIDNIEKHPLAGIGFGIGTFPNDMKVTRDPTFNLPVSAPIEKGVMPVAVVEELGILVAFLVFAWMGFLLQKAARAGFVQFCLLLTLIFVNFGEYIFFSVGGSGMLFMVLLTGAVTAKRAGVE